MKKKIFAEVGIGNDSFFSTEFDNGIKEYRINKFLKPKKILEYYIRIWLGKRVYIFSTSTGFEIKFKGISKMKILFGIGGYNK